MATHSKFKNTGILFELLVRQIAADTMSGNNSKALKIINEFFVKGRELNKELQLYQTLQKDKFLEEKKAEKFIDLVLENRKKLNNDTLKKEKYSLIKTIKESYNIEDFFKARISNYKLMASIYKLFESSLGKNLTPVDVINAKYTLIEHVTSKKANKQVIENKIVQEYSKMDKDIRLLAYKILLEKFNKKYSGLNVRQRKLLREYINNVTDSTSLRDYINREIPLIRKKLNEHIAQCDDDIVVIKLKEVSSQLPNYLKGKIIKEEHILTLMRFYNLIKELNDAHKEENK